MSGRPWLLVGLSVRPLAQAAAAAGHAVCAIDAFADRETRAACAGRVVRLPLRDGWRIAAADLGEALGSARRRHAAGGFAGIATCAGFDGQPDQFELLARAAPLAGNSAAVVRAVRPPLRWFALLDRIGAPYPATCLNPPAAPRGWLIKSAGGSGGWHVRRWQPQLPVPADAYFQRHAAGRAASALFVADGRTARVIGWQWHIHAPAPGLPWRYGGVMTANDLAVAVRQRVESTIDAIVAETALRGLCGLDFLVDGEDIGMLELNPRPTASVALYAHGDLFGMHLDGVAGRLPDSVPLPAVPAAGEAVLYAPLPLAAGASFAWPPWCSDVPPRAAAFRIGDAVCTVRASAASPHALLARLAHRLRRLLIQLKEHGPHDRPAPQRQRACRTVGPIPGR